jgi:hypothetical protein
MAYPRRFVEGEIEQRGDTLRARMRLCRDGVVAAVFKRDYPAAGATTEQIIDDMAVELDRQEPGTAKLLHCR